MRAQLILVAVLDYCRQHAWPVILTGAALAILALGYAAGHLGLSSETDRLFAANLQWRQRAAAIKAEFPQFQNLLVAVIDAREPEEAELTADQLIAALVEDHAHFATVRRPDGLPFFRTEGFLFLDKSRLEATLDRIIDAQPFLGELAKDMSARGLFTALGLLGAGTEQQRADFEQTNRTALSALHDAITETLAGNSHPLSWVRLLTGNLSGDASPYKFVLAQPRLDHAQLEPGAAATQAMRDAAKRLEFVKSGDARVRITGSVALADEEFSTVAQGAAAGTVASILLITLWLFLAVRSWRLVVPILLTLALGLALTLGFAAISVGTLNLVSVGFGILFVGLAVDFAIPILCALPRDASPTLRRSDRNGRNRPPGRRTDPRGSSGDGRRILRVRTDRFPRCRGAGVNRRHRHADRLSLHDELSSGAHLPLSTFIRYG